MEGSVGHHARGCPAASHRYALKSLLVHHQVILPVTAGKLDLGPWPQVFYAEFDGQRREREVIKMMGE